MQFMFTSLWHIKAQQVHTKKMLWSHKAFMFQFFCFFKAASHFSLTRKEGPANVEMMRFFLFCFLAHHFHSPSGITQERIADTLDMTAGPLVKHSDTKQNSRANVLYNQKSAYSHSRLSNERSTGNTFFIWITVRYRNLKKSVCRCPRLIFYLTNANISWKFT